MGGFNYSFCPFGNCHFGVLRIVRAYAMNGVAKMKTIRAILLAALAAIAAGCVTFTETETEIISGAESATAEQKAINE